MDENLKELYRIKNEQIKKAFEKNQMECSFMTREELMDYLSTLLVDGKKVAVGGSVTLNQLGIIDLIRKSDVAFYDRYDPSLSSAELEDVMRESFFADILLTSTNALTQDGCLYNIDGNGNRVASMIFGPKKVIVIAGKNKVFASEEEALTHIRQVSAPANALRLKKNTPCTKLGSCQDCFSPERICSSYVKLAWQGKKNRFHVILLDEELGY